MNSNGIDYFSFNVDFFNDDKLQLIEAEFNIKGSYIAVRLLCKIYHEGYYYQWGDDECLLFSKSIGNGIVPNTIKEVLAGLIRRSFFDKGVFEKFGILTSAGIQRRYFEAVKRRQNVEVRAELLLIDVSKYSNVDILNENVDIDNENEYIVEQSKVKESKVNNPPQTPPIGGVSSSGGGSSISSYSDKIDLRSLLIGKGVNEEEYWETMRLTANGDKNAIGTSVILQWAENPKMCPYYQIIQNLQDLNKKGQIQAMSHEDYFTYVFLRMNLMKSDEDTIRSYIQNPELFNECKKLIAECKKGGINQPGKFIIAGLRKSQRSINKQHIK